MLETSKVVVVRGGGCDEKQNRPSLLSKLELVLLKETGRFDYSELPTP